MFFTIYFSLVLFYGLDKFGFSGGASLSNLFLSPLPFLFFAQ